MTKFLQSTHHEWAFVGGPTVSQQIQEAAATILDFGK